MADIVLETTIPDAYVQKVLDMIETNEGMEITISLFRGKGGSFTFKFDEKKETENNVEFAQRFIKENLLAYLRLKAQNDNVEKVRQARIDLPDIPVEEIEEGTIT